MDETLQGVLIIMVFTSPAYILPLLAGPSVLIFFRRDDLNRMAALLILKPLLATVLWALIFVLGGRMDLALPVKAALGSIPGIGLTLAMVWVYRQVLRTETGMVMILLTGDALRWLNTCLWVALYQSVDHPLFTVGLVLPNAYAIMALVLVAVRERRTLKPTQV